MEAPARVTELNKLFNNQTTNQLGNQPTNHTGIVMLQCFIFGALFPLSPDK